MEKQIKVKVAGHPESTLTFYPKASTGGIRDGVAFENGNTGGWVIAYSDFLKMVELAKQHHAQQGVEPTRDSGEAIPGVCDEIEELWAE